MKLRILVLLTLSSLVAPADAGIIFGRKKKDAPTPEKRVPEILHTLQTDKDDHERMRAAEELRDYDPTAFPQIVPALLHALMNDPKAGVRAEAAQTLGRYRPVNQQIGQALEYAREKDDSMRVRLQARSSLMQYHWNGYKSVSNEAPPAGQTKEPPLAPPVDPKAPPQGFFPPLINPAGNKGVISPNQPANYPSIPLPPVTTPVNQPALQPIPNIPVLEATPGGFRPLPPGTVEPSPAPPADGPVLQPPAR